MGSMAYTGGHRHYRQYPRLFVHDYYSVLQLLATDSSSDGSEHELQYPYYWSSVSFQRGLVLCLGEKRLPRACG